MLENSLFLTGAAAAIAILIALWRSGHFIRSLLFSAVTGNLALLAVCYSGAFTGTLLLLNPFTVGVAAVLGVPGVLMLLVLKLVLGV